jgi:hypothetical protein
MTPRRGFFRTTGASALALALCVSPVTYAQKESKDTKDGKDNDNKRPKITLKAQPIISMAPSKVTLRAELVGGANDYEEFYCPTIEWDWDDGTMSESTSDCEPYQAGKSEIKRRFTVEHVFRAGVYRVMFKLKRRDKGVGFATVNIQVRPGLRDTGQ